MKEILGNSPSELLSLLLDGELDPAQETGLYSALASSDELRSEMRDMLSFRDSVRRDTLAFTPPVSATSMIFANAGFQIPTAQAVSAVAGGAVSSGIFSGLKDFLWSPAMTSAMASLITALVFMGLPLKQEQKQVPLESDNYQTQARIVDAEAKPVVPKVITQKEVILPKIIYRDMPISRRSGNDFSNSVSNSIRRIAQSIGQINYPVHNTQTIQEMPMSISQMPESVPVYRRRLIPMDYTVNVPVISKERDFVFMPSTSTSRKNSFDITIYTRGIAAASFPNVDIGAQADKILANMAFGAFMLHQGMLNFGFEIGSESFGQVFYNIEQNQAMRYEQYPRFLWMGLALRGIWDENVQFLAGGQPYAQFTLASTQIGPLAKCLGGVQFVSESGFGMQLGIEGSLLTYKNQDSWYTSKKIGLTYGMSVQF